MTIEEFFRDGKNRRNGFALAILKSNTLIVLTLLADSRAGLHSTHRCGLVARHIFRRVLGAAAIARESAATSHWQRMRENSKSLGSRQLTPSS